MSCAWLLARSLAERRHTHTPRHKELSTVRQSDPATRIGGDKALVPLELTLTARPGRLSVCVLCKNAFFFFFWPFFNGRTYAIRAGLLDGLGLGLPIPRTQVYGCGARIEIGAQYYSRWEITPGWDESVKDAVVDTRNAAVKDTAIPVTRC
ncbi:hypothetical protein CEP53_014450 [Fusarium sp. AF-6]|nr:hypothetical protein CEP53_014450 [Fusarium sp. AF-6]